MRRLRPGGRLVSVTNSAENLIPLWSLVGDGPKRGYFGRETGEGPPVAGRRATVFVADK